MKKIYFTFIALLSLPAFGQIQQDINKTSGTVSNTINAIDSIRFNGSQTEMEIILSNGTLESHAISVINNVTFSGELLGAVWPAGTVHCDPANPTAIVEVTNPITGEIWMDRNLGASQVATSSTDALSYGDLYQWGRRSDGHQCRTSPTTATLSSVDQPAHGDFITINSGIYDWRSPQNDNLWQGVSGVNNPCPSTYRLPTETEINAERLSWSQNNSAGAFASPLRLPVAGGRYFGDGQLYNDGTLGYYWSSSVSGSDSRGLYFGSSDASVLTFNRANGDSVRCLKD